MQVILRLNEKARRRQERRRVGGATQRQKSPPVGGLFVRLSGEAGETPALHLLAFFRSGCGLLLGRSGGGLGFRLGRFLFRGSLLRGLLRLLFSLEARCFFGGSLFAGGDGL